MERKTDILQHTIENLGGRIDKIKQDLDHSIAEESKARNEMGEQLGEQIEMVTKRLMALDSGGGASKALELREGVGRWRASSWAVGGTKLLREEYDGRRGHGERSSRARPAQRPCRHTARSTMAPSSISR